MEKFARLGIIALTVSLFASCYDRGIVDHKEFSFALPPVENLAYTESEGAVTLTWDIPGNIPPGFETPLEVSIQKVENDIYREIMIVGGEGTSREIAINADATYRFVVKLAGNLADDAKVVGKPDRVYSEGRVIEIQ